MTPERYHISGNVQRTVALIRALFGHTLRGLAPGDLAEAIETSPSNVTRLLAQLSQLGVVEEIKGSGRWRLGPMLVQGALAHQVDLDRTESELNEARQRYSRRPD